MQLVIDLGDVESTSGTMMYFTYGRRFVFLREGGGWKDTSAWMDL
jgi:hypothetical protein